jgi:hypothetical protein
MQPALRGYETTLVSPGRELRRATAKCSGLLLIALLLAGTAWPYVFKSPIGFAAFALILVTTAIGPLPAAGARARSRFMAASFMFVAFGALVLLLSIVRVFDIDPNLPVRGDFMLRQSYFLFLWFPFLLGAISFWNALGRGVISACRAWGLPTLVVLACLDIAAGRLLGDQTQLLRADYVYFFDKFGFQFVFALIYLIYLAQSRRWSAGLSLIVVYAIATKLLHSGIMFNATTGTIFFVFLVASTIPLSSRRLQALGVVAVYLALTGLLASGVLFPEWFAEDNNDVWRLMAWRSNFEALWQSGLAGMGFGTPYFPVSAENLLNSMNNQFNTLSADLANSIDPQYVRGQHSSIVNMFYRMGVIGGALFLYLNIVLIRAGFANLKHRDPAVGRLGHATLVLFLMQIVQMTVHVGIETPIFLSIYMLTAALVLHLPSIAATQALVKTGRAPLDGSRSR